MTKVPSCYEVIGGVDDVMQDVLPNGVDYFVLGGIASAALRHPDTIIVDRDKIVEPTADSAESVIRDNRTKRDIDILVNDVVSDEAGKAIAAKVSESVDNQLEVAVFGFDEYKPRVSRTARTLATAAQWISRRTIDEEGTHRYELHPLEQKVSPETYERWMLTTPNGNFVPILNPAAHVLAYRMRSISGLRVKDSEKVAQMSMNVFNNSTLFEMVKDGPLKAWREFADGIEQLRDGTLPPDSPLIKDEASRAELAAFRWKGGLLHMLESNETIVKLAQEGPLQKALNLFVRAK